MPSVAEFESFHVLGRCLVLISARRAPTPVASICICARGLSIDNTSFFFEDLQ